MPGPALRDPKASSYNPSMTRGKVAKKMPAPSPRRSPFGLDRGLVIGLAGALFVLPLFILPNASEYGYTKTILALVLISILGVLWGVNAWRKGTWTLRVPWITWPFLALVAASLFSLLGATNGRFVMQSLVLLVYFFFLLLLVTNAVREKRDAALLLGTFLASVSLVTLYGLLQYAGVMRGPTQGAGLEQVISTLGNKEYVAGLLAYVLFPATILVFRVRSPFLRALTVFLIAFNFGSLLLFDQAGANVALAAAAIVLIAGCLIFRPAEPLRRARRWILALLIALTLAYLVEAPSGPLNSVVGLSADAPSWVEKVWSENSGAVRTWDWWVGFEMWKSSPWIGVGLGNYKLDFLPYKAQFLATPQGSDYGFYIARAAQAHNEYVQVLAELGLLGALALVAFLVLLALSLLLRIVQNRDPADRLDLILYVAGLTAVVVHALVSFPAHLPASSLAAILACGLALSPAYGERALKVFSIRGWGLRAAVLGLAAAGAVVSVVAIRDLAANVLMRNGILELQLGQTAQAQATFERSLRLDFAPHQALFYLSTAQALQGDLSAAFESADLCLTRFVDENMYVLYAELAANAGKYAEAQEAISLVLATRPSNEIETRARYIQAVVALREGNALEATTQLEALVRDAPDFEGARITLGNVLLARGLRDEAEVVYVQALARVEWKLVDAEQKLAAASTMTVSAYGELRSSIATLRSERDSINERLRSIRQP
jgi:O-antigen ligase/Tfp pilus assembly protein PilF